MHYLRAGSIVAAAIALALAVPTPACAQYPGQLAKSTANSAKDTPTLRAISVLEWTGEEGHPKASRLVPVAIFDGQELQDGSIYLSQPEPLSLAGEVEYELQRNGKPIGLFDIRNTGHEQGSWVGYGSWKAAVAPKPKPKPKAPVLSLNPSWDDQDDRPVLHRKHHADDPPTPAGTGQTGDSKPGAAASGSGSSSSGSTSTAPTSDPDRPTLHRKPADADSDSTSGSSSSPTPDPDRPTLHKKAPSDDSASNTSTGKQKKKKKNADESYVDSLPDVADPDRPRLKRGQGTGGVLNVLPSLIGMPPDLNQAVAVSDARTPVEHQWSFAWADPADQDKMKATLEQMARDALSLTPPPTPAPAPVKHSASRKQSKAVVPPPPPPPAPLADEDFRVYELAYGAGATFVLTAHTGGQGAADKYAAFIAQPDLYGNVLVLLKSVTDAAHLDDTPRMRLVDAVDAEADNRAELLFELRGQTERQFALYRVLRGQAERIFATGPADIVVAPRAN